jgi:pimeloyl-ACP methyl ester carboxylesterase
MTSPKRYTTGFATSKDGTKIHYRQIGSGKGLVLVHGGMMYSQNFMTLAELLANDFIVYVPDRCGRGLSEMHKNYSLLAESEDIQAILNQTNTENAFGLSSGAIIVLQIAILNSTLKKIALFEPPIPVSGANPSAWANSYKLAISKNNFGKALISIVKGTSDTSLIKSLPSFITVPFMNIAIKLEAKKNLDKDEVHLKSLITAMQYDIKVVNQSQAIIEKCKNLAADILLLGGQRSKYYLKTALDTLSAALPQAKRTEFSNVGHLAADNGGKPEVVANELRKFFKTNY